MKELKFYPITREQYERTEYRPIGVQLDTIETEEGWSYKDIVENIGEGWEADKVVDTRDLIVWKITNVNNQSELHYIVETKNDKSIFYKIA